MGNQHTGKMWHPDEDKKLAELFPRTDTKELVDVFGCSVKTIQNRSHRLGIRKDPKWLAEFKRNLAIASYAKAGNSGFKKGNTPWNAVSYQKDSRPRKNSVFTGHGFQDIQVVPGGRIVTHKISDVHRRAV